MERVLDHAGALLIGGRSFAKEVHERLGTPLERFTIVPGAVDTSRFSPGAPPPPGEPVRLLYHGRVDRRKGVLDFVNALACITPDGWTATVSGIGPDFDTARYLAEKLLPGRVAFTGYADYETVPELYRGHDVFVSPTYAEGFSNTILEAMASGHAILSCRAVGVTDCLRDGDNGLLVEPGDVPALAAALARLIGDEALRARLAANALEEARRTYSWETVAAQIMSHYAGLLGTSPDNGFKPNIAIEPCRYRAEPHLL
jgi:glycosyltransferase involved in cell wall biosynthesis